MLCSRYLSVAMLLFSPFCLSCDLNVSGRVNAALPSLRDAQSPRQILLSNNIELQVPDADGVLAMHSADGLALIDQIAAWPTDSGQISSIKAQPVALDWNYDGITDALYIVDAAGLLWFVTLNETGFSEPLLVADFSQTQAEFRQPLQLAQVLAPDGQGAMQRQTMLLLTGSLAEGDILLAVKHNLQRLTPWQLTDLTDRTQLGGDESHSGIAAQLWLQIQQGGGWYVRLNQRVMTKPDIYAGVVYVTGAHPDAVNSDCVLTDDAESQLHAFHLHHAGLVYARRNWDITQQRKGKLLLQEQDGQLVLSLQDDAQQQALLTELQAIDASCADCVTPLDDMPFPRLIRLATFQIEQDAH